MNNAVWTALYSRLQTGTALTSILAGTTSIYHQQAPDGAALPYVIFSQAAGGFEGYTPHVDGDCVVRIRAYADDAKEAQAISTAVFGLLDRLPLTITGWNNPGLFAEAPHLELVETDESGVAIYSCGDDYRLRLDKS